MKGKSFRNSKPIDTKALNDEIDKINEFSSSGFIITDFPTTTD